MDDDQITFSELRKIQKKASRQEQLIELSDNFILKVADYLSRKKDMSGEDREYKNAKRVFDNIISQRRDKIVKNAQISVKSGLDGSDIDMLPEEQKLFRDAKSVFQEHQDHIEEKLEGDFSNQEFDVDETKSEDVEEDEEGDNVPEDGDYVEVEMKSDVPEFMGTDLESYGPFEEGEEAELPEENAEILVNRGSAEMV